MSNDSTLIDYEGHSVREKVGETEDAVSLGDSFVGITKQRKTGAGLLSKLAVPVLVIQTDPQHLRARSFEFGDITLIRLDLRRSTGRGGTDIKGQNNGLLATEIRELDHVPVLIGQ